MSKLSVFLHPVSTQEEKEVIISNRFQDENGESVPFRIRALTQEENDAITKKATRRIKENGQSVEWFDSVDFCHRLVVAATVYPDFSSKELCEGYGVMDPLLVPGKMLFSGEYSKLLQAIKELSGFEDLEEEAKN
nr:MAG TPA: tail assembly chaperone protein [Caudoviricetes sp.]